MPIAEGTRALKTYTGEWDFAKDGGAISTITLRSEDGPIPTGSVILGAVGQAVLVAGRANILPAFTGTTTRKTTAARSPTVTIATAPFTAGKLKLVLVYK